MCGRYTLVNQADVIDDLQVAIDLTAGSEWWKPRYNVAPTQPAPIVTLHDGQRALEMARWGLLPFWASKPGAKPPLMINARVESAFARPVFRDLLARKRCLVPADGFFEWKRDGKKPLPLYFHPEPRRIIAFAGMWARMKTDAGETHSFAILTGPPNELVESVHDRMPIVLDPSAYAAWLDPSLDVDGARALLALPPAAGWRAEPVSTRVNSAANDDPTCIAPDVPVQGSLF